MRRTYFRFNRDSPILVLFRYGTPVKWLNLVVNRFEFALSRSRLASRPYELVIDATNMCHLGCRFCPTGRKEHGRDKGAMSKSTFEAIIDATCRYAFLLYLYNWGEPFLNANIIEMARYAESRRISTRISTNFSVRLDDEKMEALVRSGLSQLIISGDGVDQQSYEAYRSGGDFGLVVENTRRLLETRRRLRARTPLVRWRFLLFEHNKHLTDRALRMAADLGVDVFETLVGFTDSEGGVSPGEVPKEIRSRKCFWLWKQLVVHWDARIAPCCMEYYEEDDFGRFADQSLRSLWNSPQHTYARSLFARRGSIPRPTGGVYCEGCYKLGGPNRPWNDAKRHASQASPG